MTDTPRDPLADVLEHLGYGDTTDRLTGGPDVYQEWGMTPREFAARLRAAGCTTQAEALAAVRAAVEGLPGYRAHADNDDDPGSIDIYDPTAVHRDDVLAAIDKVADTP